MVLSSSVHHNVFYTDLEKTLVSHQKLSHNGNYQLSEAKSKLYDMLSMKFKVHHRKVSTPIQPVVSPILELQNLGYRVDKF